VIIHRAQSNIPALKGSNTTALFNHSLHLESSAQHHQTLPTMHLSFFTLALMALTATAIPTDLVAAPAPADIEVDSVSALAKCDDNRTPWQGGGCQWVRTYSPLS